MYSIGQLAQETDTKIPTIRYYEKMALLPKPGRTEGNHRVYSETHLLRLRFIRRSRELGFSQQEISELLGLNKQSTPNCRDVNNLTQHHLARIREKISDLQAIEQTLLEMSGHCSKKAILECPIIDSLFYKGTSKTQT